MNKLRKMPLYKNMFRFTLGKRLTLYFIVFGFILGYIVFTMASMFSTHNTVYFMSSMIVKKELKEVFASTRPDLFLTLLENNDRALMEKFRIIKNIPKDYSQVARTSLYYFDNVYYRWKELTLNKSGTRVISEELSKPDEKNLMHYIKSNGMIADRLMSQTESIYINLTRPVDRTKYLLRLEIKRESILSFIKENRVPFVAFDIFILLISALLGKFFTRKVTKPIREITIGAAHIASGKYEYSLKIPSRDEIGILANSMNTMAGKVQSNIDEISRHLNTMQTMNRIDKAVLSSISRKDLMGRVVGIVRSLFKDVEIIILLRNEKKAGFDILSFNTWKKPTLMDNEPCIFDSDIFREYLGRMNKAFQITRDSANGEVFDYITRLASTYAGINKIGSLLNIPMTMQEKSIGVILIIKNDISGFDSSQVEAAKMLADQVCVAFQSVKIFEEKESLLFGILLALTNSIDAKSKWTAGHSERVAMYSEQLAMHLDFNEQTMRELTISAVLHDIGKIAVPEAILDKPSKLTAEEFDIIKQHPAVGANIISNIPSYDSILPGILYHHEHWDGSGYPQGLKGVEIPLSSRIITIADVFDAITEERPYRKGMRADEAISFMEDQKKKLFDAELAGIFINKVAMNIAVSKKLS